MIPLYSAVRHIILRRSNIGACALSNFRSLKTSTKKDDTSAIAEPHSTEENQSVQRRKRFFYDYGFNGATEEEETNNMNAVAFMYITLLFMGGGFFFTYRPEMTFRDWAQREAYFELRRREELGLPVIDPNYVDPSTVELPSDEELGDTEIII